MRVTEVTTWTDLDARAFLVEDGDKRVRVRISTTTEMDKKMTDQDYRQAAIDHYKRCYA